MPSAERMRRFEGPQALMWVDQNNREMMWSSWLNYTLVHQNTNGTWTLLKMYFLLIMGIIQQTLGVYIPIRIPYDFCFGWRIIRYLNPGKTNINRLEHVLLQWESHVHSMVDFPAKPLFLIVFLPTQKRKHVFSLLQGQVVRGWCNFSQQVQQSGTKLRDSPCQLVLGISGSSKVGKNMESGMPEKFKLTIPLTKHRIQQPFIHMDHPKIR